MSTIAGLHQAKGQFAPEIEAFQALCAAHHIPRGTPQDLFAFPWQLSKDEALQGAVAEFVLDLQHQASLPHPLADILSILLVGIGGPAAADAGPEFDSPISLLTSFLVSLGGWSTPDLQYATHLEDDIRNSLSDDAARSAMGKPAPADSQHSSQPAPGDLFPAASLDPLPTPPSDLQTLISHLERSNLELREQLAAISQRVSRMEPQVTPPATEPAAVVTLPNPTPAAAPAPQPQANPTQVTSKATAPPTPTPTAPRVAPPAAASPTTPAAGLVGALAGLGGVQIPPRKPSSPSSSASIPVAPNGRPAPPAAQPQPPTQTPPAIAQAIPSPESQSDEAFAAIVAAKAARQRAIQPQPPESPTATITDPAPARKPAAPPRARLLTDAEHRADQKRISAPQRRRRLIQAAVFLVAVGTGGGVVLYNSLHAHDRTDQASTTITAKAPENADAIAAAPSQPDPSDPPEVAAAPPVVTPPARVTIYSASPTNPIEPTRSARKPSAALATSRPDAARSTLRTGPLTQTPADAEPINVSSRVMAQRLVSSVPPAYPRIASMTRLQGVVVLKATIAKDGTVEHVHALGGHYLLRGAAANAVKNWRYRPYLLNGKPVEVATLVTIDFALSHK